jgi:hypothetical protein
MNLGGTFSTLSTVFLVAASAMATLDASSSAQATGAGSGATSGVCAGVTHCRLVATTDVGGDGRADQVGWRQLSERSVQIRVYTATGRLMCKTVDVRFWWGGGAWAGAARVDGVVGSELLVGSMQGAHTPMYTMLTYRDGALAVEKSPSPLSPLWQVDAADGDYMGWWRHTLANGHVAMTQKIASRVGSGPRFRGHNVTYAWTKGSWVRTTSSAHSYATGRAASVIAGFHVTGLKAFPGVK